LTDRNVLSGIVRVLIIIVVALGFSTYKGNNAEFKTIWCCNEAQWKWFIGGAFIISLKYPALTIKQGIFIPHSQMD